jgi:hypothetical protein
MEPNLLPHRRRGRRLNNLYSPKKYYWDQIKYDEMYRSCSTREANAKWVQNYVLKA